jgi:hypothetical protein
MTEYAHALGRRGRVRFSTVNSLVVRGGFGLSSLASEVGPGGWWSGFVEVFGLDT